MPIEFLVASKVELLEPGKADLWDAKKKMGNITSLVLYQSHFYQWRNVHFSHQ